MAGKYLTNKATMRKTKEKFSEPKSCTEIHV